MGSNFFVLDHVFFVREKKHRSTEKIDPHLLTFGAPSVSLVFSGILWGFCYDEIRGKDGLLHDGFHRWDLFSSSSLELLGR